MDIAYLSPEYPKTTEPDGGLANYLRKVGLDLSNRAHRISIFCLSNKNKHWFDGDIEIFEIKEFKLPYQFYRFKKLCVFLPFLTQIQSSKRLAKVFWREHNKFPFDIIQASSYKSPGYVMRRNQKVPMVCRVSSYRPMIRSAEGRRRNFCQYLTDWLEIRQVVDVQSAFAPSQLMADTYAKFEGCSLQVIRTPVEKFSPEMDHSLYESSLIDKEYLLYFGTLKLVKGVDLLAGIISPILESHSSLYFVFIGRDDGMNNRQKIFDYITELNPKYKDRLLYYPSMPKATLYPIIMHSLGVVMPSRVDNYPNACLEALSLGVPVVGTYQSSLDEMIVDGKTGFLANNGDPDSIKDAIERLLRMTNEQRRQMKCNIAEVVNEIKKEDRVGQLIDFYNEVIASFHHQGVS